MSHSALIPLPQAPTAPALARRIVDRVERLRPDAAINARLLVSELVANAVRHVRREGQIGMHVEVRDDALHVEVMDPGGGFVPRARTESSPLGGGWGLHMVDVLSDRWGVDGSGPTRVWFEIDRAVGA
jgi:anti-sigma regulatory factor (Ser/Thr protein kinase)